ncbi:MAG: hypothetical protein ACTSYI_02090 [Promethearchaeota archaeon]
MAEIRHAKMESHWDLVNTSLGGNMLIFMVGPWDFLPYIFDYKQPSLKVK